MSPYDIFARELTISGSQSLQHTCTELSGCCRRLLDGDAFITDRIPLAEVTRALEVVRGGQSKTQLVP